MRNSNSWKRRGTENPENPANILMNLEYGTNIFQKSMKWKCDRCQSWIWDQSLQENLKWTCMMNIGLLSSQRNAMEIWAIWDQCLSKSMTWKFGIEYEISIFKKT